MSSRGFLSKLQNVETPCYFYDMELLNKTLDVVVKESSRYGYKVHYAMKANFDPRILEAVRKAGLGADCVSGNEVKGAITAGIPASEIVFAGVAKSDKEIRYALEQNIFAFNVESGNELEVINQIAGEMGRKAHVAFRINPDVDPKTHKNISTGHADSKFGISYTEVDEVIASLDNLKNIEIVGLHFHVGSQIRDMKVFENLCNRVNVIKDWFKKSGIVLKHINLGGGLGINYDDPESELIPDFAGYFAVFKKYLDVEPGQTVHFELGRSIVAQCGELITRVLYNKKTASGTNYILVDAGMTDLIRPALYSAKHKIVNLSADKGDEVYTVGGPICESSDIFARGIHLPVTKRGDILAMLSAGAYGYAMVSHYNMRDLPGVIYSDQL